VGCLLDQSFDRRLVRSIREAGHDVTMVGVDCPPGISDSEIVDIELREQPVFFSNDRDFGDLVVNQSRPNAGVVYLRLRLTTAQAKWQRLSQALSEYTDDLGRFLVVSENAMRIR
jgi:predicted nuclease of predicted toxin-antitoxin system